jgi:hypothetical protein
VHSNGHRGSGSRPRTWARLTPQQEASAFELALEWRRSWRAEVGVRRGNGEAPAKPAKRLPLKPDASRAAFAAGIARAEFGRFYWDAKRQRLPPAKTKPRSGK